MEQLVAVGYAISHFINEMFIGLPICSIDGVTLPVTLSSFRYVALNMLMRAIAVDALAVQRHRTTILECVKVTIHATLSMLSACLTIPRANSCLCMYDVRLRILILCYRTALHDIQQISIILPKFRHSPLCRYHIAC